LVRLTQSRVVQVVRQAGARNHWEDNGLKQLWANLVRGRVKLISNDSIEQ